MRIVSWNCNCKFREKYSEIKKLNADIYVIQECEDPSECKDANYQEFARNSLWIGRNTKKGLGVFAREGISLKKIDWHSYCLRYFLPVRINDSFDLLAVWAGAPYIEEYYIYQSINFANYNNQMVIIGDFNSNHIWDKKNKERNHIAVVNELKALGLESVYHSYCGEEQGRESKKTFYLYRHADKAYHIDHCFADMSRIQHYQVMDEAEWLCLSDHMPLVLDVDA